MALITNYEVYLFDKGEWSIYSRYPSSQRDIAISEAKELEEQTNRPTKVVKERYDPKTNHGDEVVVYLSERIMQGSKYYSKSGSYSSRYGSDSSWLDNISPQRIGKNKRVISYTGLFLRLFLLILASLVIASLISYLVVLLLNNFGSGWSSSTLYSITFGAFIIIFILISIFSSIILIPWKDIDLSSPLRIEGLSPLFKSRYQKMSEYNPFDSFMSFFRYLFSKKEQEQRDSTGSEISNEEVKEAEEGEEGEEERVLEEESVSKADISEELRTKEVIREGGEEKLKVSKKEEEKASVSREKMEKIIKIIDNFVHEVLDVAKRYDIRKDIYTRVSINLIVAGASERLSTFFNLPKKEYKDILGYAVKKVSLSTYVSEDSQIRTFYEAFNDPGLESYHRELIVCGNRSMDKVLRKIKRDAFEGIGDQMRLWRDLVTKQIKPIEDIEKETKIITLMFTDISGSTEISQNYGQEFMQNILHIHNSIVREAIRLYRGKEIKHLGDGMFLSFVSAIEGIRAAIYIQDRIHIHNLAHPEEAFYVRIGMNSGEPISEDGDLFGTVVQVASRVCEHAGGGEILITEALHNLLGVEEFKFKDEGEIKLKGIKERMHLYRVSLQEDRRERSNKGDLSEVSKQEAEDILLVSGEKEEEETEGKGLEIKV